MNFKNDCPLQKQIVSADETIKGLMERLEKLEQQKQQLPSEKRIIVETEVIEIKKLLNTNKELLAKLHKENSKSFALTACLVFFCFLAYGLYVMIFGN